MKKILLIFLVVSSFLLYSTPSFALLSLSVGVPIGQAITGKNAGQTYGNAPDKTSGYFLGASFASIGLGIDSYTTKFKTDGTDGSWDAGYDAGLKTNMTNLFYQLPVPVVNLIIGLGVGTTEYDCTICETYTEKGSATQWYTSIGIPLIPLFDIHLSYRSITSKNIIKNKMEGTKDDNSGSVTGLGISFNF